MDWKHVNFVIVTIIQVTITGCQNPDVLGRGVDCPFDGHACDTLSVNDIQAIGSHNSYKIAIPEPELAVIRQTSPETAITLEYGHIPLHEQLELGMRQLELDVYHDPEGRRYSNPLLPRIITNETDATAPPSKDLQHAGFKVLHVQDIDVRSHCWTLIACLQEIKSWSEANPRHAPLLVLLNAKDEALDFPGTVVPLLFDEAAFDALDAEILSVFPRHHLITPDDVRGKAPSLRDSVLADGWPLLEDSLGKMIFALDENTAKVQIYSRGQSSLEGLPMFVNSIDEMKDHAAYFTMNDPVNQQESIRSRVRNGFLVRSRADADTHAARDNNTSQRDAAFASGAQYISTDYYLPNEEFSDYQVRLPGGVSIRCNPIRMTKKC